MISSISFVKLNNMKMRLFLPLSAFAALSVCLMLSSCAGGGRAGGGRAVTDDPAAESRRFPLVDVPGVIVDREEAAEYLGLHYWDSFTDTAEVHACDSMRVNGVTRSEVEQKFADYTGLIGALGRSRASRSAERLYDRAEAFERAHASSDLFETVVSLAQKYWYDPNSPLRDEELYLVFAERLALYDGFSEAERDRYAHDAAMCSLNRPGDKAADFFFSDASGNVMNLYGIEAEYLILFFSNPGCEACAGMVRALDAEPVRRLVKEGRLAVVNIYIDEDVASWHSHLSDYPSIWYNGYDPNLVIRTDLLYNVRAIPSVYVLDGDKRVILKDATDAALTSFISGLLRTQSRR